MLSKCKRERERESEREKTYFHALPVVGEEEGGREEEIERGRGQERGTV